VIARYESTAGAVAEIVGGRMIHGDAGCRIQNVSTDSREIDTQTLYVPIRGENFDGHTFIEKLAQEKKISCFLTERPDDERIAQNCGVPAIQCDNTLYALGSLGLAHRCSAYNGPLVGVTGTNGKTTTKELLAAILSVRYNVHKSQKNYNNEIGVPFTLMGLSRSHEAGVIEMGMNHTGEISRLSKMTLPTMAIITNAGEGHLEFLGTVENVANAKSEIVDGMAEGSIIILNEESACFEMMRDRALSKKMKIVTVGIEKGMVCPERYKLYPDATEIQWRGVTIRVPIYGIHNITNIMSALAAGYALGVTVDEAAAALVSFANVGKRNDLHQGEFVLVNDTYNANPLSVRYALRSLAEIYPSSRRIAVLADMKELGDQSENLHRRSGVEVAVYGFQILLTLGGQARFIAEGARDAGMSPAAIHHFESKEECTEFLKRVVLPGDAILVKGSRSMTMEEVADQLIRA
jgi:UDP-N-acetylmuramoyl-tripeptide--D-alanyl-D-alanine ligase